MSVRGFLLTAGGLGHLRPAPGTWGSTPPVIVALVMLAAIGGPHWSIDVAIVLLGVLGSIACVRFGVWAEQAYGKKDPGCVVADEVAGQAIPLLALPWRSFGDDGGVVWNLALALIAFGTFRLFDITKPPPARGLQRLSAGWGILVDDLIAGVYAAAATHLMVWLVLPRVLA